MTDYQLEPNEGILLRAENVERYSAGDKEESLDEMVLTNKNIICTYEKSTGLFSPTKTVVDKRPLEFIGSANGSIQIFQVDDDDYGLGLQIVYKNGTREHYVFESTKKELSNWYSAVHNAVSLLSTTQPYSYHEDTKNETKRVFCNQCGKQVDASSKFCNECGAKIYVDSSMNDNRKSTTDRSKRQTVYEGTLHKCPNCGEILLYYDKERR